MSLDDDRVLFYLRHRDQIEEWAALRTEAAVAVDGWLFELRPRIETLCSELGRTFGCAASTRLTSPGPPFA
jgi:hypothetical protein